MNLDYQFAMTLRWLIGLMCFAMVLGFLSGVVAALFGSALFGSNRGE